jgi:hypothetical protein
MSAAPRQSLMVPDPGLRKVRSKGDHKPNIGIEEDSARAASSAHGDGKPRVFVTAENRLLREALSRMLAKSGTWKWSVQ